MTLKELYKNPYYNKQFTEVELIDKTENGANCIITRDYALACIVRAREIVKKHKLNYDPGTILGTRSFWEDFNDTPLFVFYSKFPKIKMGEFEELLVCKHLVESHDLSPHKMEFVHRMEWQLDIEDPKFKKVKS